MKKTLAYKLFFVGFGTLVFTFGVALFVLPYDLLTGGVAGITILFKPFIPNLDENLSISILNTLLFIIGFIVLGKEFALQTIVSTIAYPVFLYYINRQGWVIDVDPILAAIYSGILCGGGIGIVIRQGGSTGGTDVPPLVVSKYTGIEPSKAILVMDAVTVIAGVWIYGLPSVLLGLISVYVSSLSIEKALSANSSIRAKEVRIISDKYEEISRDVHTILDRGSTIIEAYGGYKGEKRPMLLVVAYPNQYDELIRIINTHDKEAFVIVTETTDVHGEGFTFNAPRI